MNEWRAPKLGYGSVSMKEKQRGNARGNVLETQSDNMSVQPWA